MAFSEQTVLEAFRRAKGRCETCGKELSIDNRGRDSGRGSWEAHHRTRVESGGGDSLSNCKILCWVCHRKTL